MQSQKWTLFTAEVKINKCVQIALAMMYMLYLQHPNNTDDYEYSQNISDYSNAPSETEIKTHD